MSSFVRKLFLVTTAVCIIDSLAQLGCSISSLHATVLFVGLQLSRLTAGSLVIYLLPKRKCNFLFLLIYWIYLLVVLFGIGVVVSYKDFVWSLDFQIIHQYMTMIMLLYIAEDQLNRQGNNKDKDNDKDNEDKIDVESNYLEVSSESSESLSLTRKRFRERLSKESLITQFTRTSTRSISVLSENQLVIGTLVLLPLTFGLSYLLHKDARHWTPRQLMYLKFPGEIFVRTISALMVPLIVTSLAYACTSIDILNSSDILYAITLYFVVTTLLASLVGVTTVLAIGPRPHNSTSPSMTPTQAPPKLLLIDICLDTIRNFLTDSLPEALTGSYYTVLHPPKLENGSVADLPTEKWAIGSKKIEAPNVSGLILFAMSVGLLAGRLGEHGRPVVKLVYALNNILMIIIVTISYAAPIGMFFIVLPQTIDADVATLFRDVLWFSITVITGLSIHLFIVLPLIYFLLTKKNPYTFFTRFPSTISKAFGTDCSSVALADAMVELERMGYNKEVIGFCIPLGSTLNMDGTALYQSIATIFLAHFLGIPLSNSQLISVFISASLISVGTAGMPQASLISIILILNTIGLNLENAALILMVDSILDRFRTIANVFSNLFGAVIVSHLFRKKDPTDSIVKRTVESTESSCEARRVEAYDRIKVCSRTPNLKRVLSVENLNNSSKTRLLSIENHNNRSNTRPMSLQNHNSRSKTRPMSLQNTKKTFKKRQISRKVIHHSH